MRRTGLLVLVQRLLPPVPSALVLGRGVGTQRVPALPTQPHEVDVHRVRLRPEVGERFARLSGSAPWARVMHGPIGISDGVSGRVKEAFRRVVRRLWQDEPAR